MWSPPGGLGSLSLLPNTEGLLLTVSSGQSLFSYSIYSSPGPLKEKQEEEDWPVKTSGLILDQETERNDVES